MVKPKSELRAIITSEVPIAFLNSKRNKLTKAGMIKKPPPVPINPVTKPTNIP